MALNIPAVPSTAWSQPLHRDQHLARATPYPQRTTLYRSRFLVDIFLSLLYPICFMSLESSGVRLDHFLFSDSSMLFQLCLCWQLAGEMVEVGMDG